MAKKSKKEVSENVAVVEIEQPTMASGVEQTPEPRKKKAKAAAPAPTTDTSMTLEDLAAKYLAHLEDVGKSTGTCFSYRLELVLALDELGTNTKLAELTPVRVLEFFVSDRVTKTKSGVLKAKPTVDKTRRVLRLALEWAQETGLIAAAPLPEQAATY